MAIVYEKHGHKRAIKIRYNLIRDKVVLNTKIVTLRVQITHSTTQIY